MYASFWQRFFALVIDNIILSVASSIVGFIIGLVIGGGMQANANPTGEQLIIMIALYGIFFIAYCLYFPILESSASQATPGKMAVGIKVVDLNGQRISFLRALGRYFAHAISQITLLIGFMMVCFTEKKQALHDMISGTLVVTNDYDPSNPPAPGPMETGDIVAIVFYVLYILFIVAFILMMFAVGFAAASNGKF
ncbi:putative RDD family membrane protein YckC [Elusimicrobium posterum]|uniref:RDD family protein n=1 Tax=Elusimicrobium posterum TaxID=3116653 RepID=UPI003C75C00A